MPEDQEIDPRRRFTETVQSRLILRSVRDARPFPADWEERPTGVDFFYRENTLLVRTWLEDRVRELLPRVLPGIDFGDTDVRGSCTRLTWAGGGDNAVFEALGAIERAFGPGLAGPEHLLYVCGHSCRAKEPEEVEDGAPSPRPQVGEHAKDPRCRHGKGVDVVVLDTGVDEETVARHRWMRGVTGDADHQIPQEPPETRPTRMLAQDAGHGTTTAGCVRVTAPEANVRVVNAARTLPLEPDGAPVGAQWELDLADAVRDALSEEEVVVQGVVHRVVPHVLLVNFAAFSWDGRPMLGFTSLYDDLVRHLKELLVVAPAGNDHDERKLWPASFSWVVSVGGLARNWRDLASWTSRGRTVDVYAPGEDVVNAFPAGRYTVAWQQENLGEVRQFDALADTSGTSISAPFVAGLVASRMSTTGQTSRRAWADLLELAERQALPGEDGTPYPVLYPGQGCGTTTRGCGCC